MKKLVILLIFISNVTLIFGQITIALDDIDSKKLPDKIKSVRRYHNDVLLNVCTYDTSRNLLFNYYRQYHEFLKGEKWLTMITANIYNNLGKIEKSYNLHSNVGLSILSYEYDSLMNNTKINTKNNDYEKDKNLINSNPYSYISEIMSINDLVKHPKIKEIESTVKTSSTIEHFFDSIGNITKLHFKNDKGDEYIHTFEYDIYNNNIFTSYWGKTYYGENYSESYSELFQEYVNIFEKQTPIIFDFFNEEQLKERPKPIKSNLVQSVKIGYNSDNKIKRIMDNIYFYKYDKENRLIEATRYFKGDLKLKIIYEYDSKNQMIRNFSYDYDWNPNRISFERTYIYDEYGNIIEETVKQHRGGGEYTIKYLYEYYK